MSIHLGLFYALRLKNCVHYMFTSTFLLKFFILPMVIWYQVILQLYGSKYLLLNGQVSRVFANGPGDLGSIPDHVIPKTSKMVLDTSLFNTQQYKVCIKSKVEQSRERSSVLPTHWYSIYWKEPSGRPRLWSPTYLVIYY